MYLAMFRIGFHLGPLGSGSDYTAFVDHAGVPALNMGFGGGDSGGVYHSIYDSFTWYSRFSDGDYKHGRALAQVIGTSLVRLAEAPVLPFEFGTLAKNVRVYVDEIQKLAADSKHSVEFSEVSAQIARLEAMCADLSPVLGQAKIIARQACYRPVTRDGLPLIGRVPGVSGAYIATGHSVWGILNAPATGEAMAELITEGEARTIDLSPFDPARLPPLDPARLRM